MNSVASPKVIAHQGIRRLRVDDGVAAQFSDSFAVDLSPDAKDASDLRGYRRIPLAPIPPGSCAGQRLTLLIILGTRHQTLAVLPPGGMRGMRK